MKKNNHQIDKANLPGITIIGNKACNEFVVLCLLFFSLTSNGQDSSSNNKFDRNVVTAGAFGHSLSLYSANYERLFKLSRNFIYTLSTGIGYSPGDSVRTQWHKGTTTIPVVLSLLAGKKKHYIQLSAAYSASFNENFIDSTTAPPTVYKKFQGTYSLGLGYRYMWNDFVAEIYPMLWWSNNPTDRFGIFFGMFIGGRF